MAQYWSRNALKFFLRRHKCIYRFQRIHHYSSMSNDKISKIVDQISCLTLKETAELVSQLKIHLNIQDIAPVVTSVPLSTSEPVHQENDEEKEEKRLFNVTLESYDPAAKAKVIKEIKSILGLNLVESKKFVESSPKMLKEGVNKEDADKIKKTFEDLGAKISLS
ncbi:ribosomal protein L7/L12 [Pneumocystis jirovecii RU7]|uniref:Ribosomal protein L7/L12 n=1 Tax=Pneumocystis jirovecii (strain RU7) TaxID=1408657 RepID=A0A0W4ZHQ1_PNEJ7|nr:ribosomal protein L7/L12 [Pneumocystis jirovecii RU7]KTW27898.1 ribosomal protein L7/L12 [Pneumocystis jirovecii RU7]